MGIFGKKVIATITEEENKKFEEFAIKESAIKSMQENLLEQMMDLTKQTKDFWEEIRNKYDITQTKIYLNRDTGEITEK